MLFFLFLLVVFACCWVLVVKRVYFCLFFFYNVRFFSVALARKKGKRIKVVRFKKKSYQKPMSLRKKAAIANFKFKWFDRMYDFLYSLNTYGDVVKFGVQFEKIVGRELLKEWRDFNKKKNKSKLWKVWRYSFSRNFLKLRVAIYKRKKYLSFKKRYRPWKQQKKQKLTTFFFYKLRRSLFFKRYAYRFKLLQSFFFRYTFMSKKLFFSFKKKKNAWFWTSMSRYLHLEQYFRYQLYYFLKQIFFFKRRKQFSTWDWQAKIYLFRFQKLKLLLGQKFLKVNSIVITNLFYLVFLYDVIELSYFKFYQQITSFKKNRGAFRFYKLGFFDRHSSKPANFNFKKRIRKPIQGFVEKKKKGGIFSFFVAAKRKIKGKRHYYSYLSKRLSFYRLTQNYFLYSFYFLPFFKRFRTKFKAALRRLLRKKTKFSKKHRKFIRKFLKSRKKAIMSIVYGLTMLRWRSQYSQWAKKKKKRNYILKVYSRRKLNGKKKLNRELRLGLGKFFKFFSWEQRRVMRLYKEFFRKQWIVNRKFLKKKKRSTANRWVRKRYQTLTKLNSLQYFRNKRRKYYKHQYFIKSKRLSFREIQSKMRRFWLFKKIDFFKQLFAFYKLNKLLQWKHKRNNAINLLKSSRLLAYIPYRVARVVIRKHIWKSRFFVLKRKELQLLFFSNLNK